MCVYKKDIHSRCMPYVKKKVDRPNSRLHERNMIVIYDQILRLHGLESKCSNSELNVAIIKASFMLHN